MKNHNVGSTLVLLIFFMMKRSKHILDTKDINISVISWKLISTKGKSKRASKYRCPQLRLSSKVKSNIPLWTQLWVQWAMMNPWCKLTVQSSKMRYSNITLTSCKTLWTNFVRMRFTDVRWTMLLDRNFLKITLTSERSRKSIAILCHRLPLLLIDMIQQL